MTKIQEEQMLIRLERLEKELIKLREERDNKKLEKHTYSVAEVASILGKTPQAVYMMIERHELESVKLGTTKVLCSSLKKVLGYEC